MNKRELIECITNRLKDEGISKPITIPRHSLTVSDRDGNSCEFHVKSKDKSLSYTQKDVAAIVDMMLVAIQDTLKNGDRIEIYGFGVLKPHYRAPRKTKDPFYGKEVDVEARYVPKFTAGKGLKMAVRLWELSQAEKEEHMGGDI